jgi:hypothetical protein
MKYKLHEATAFSSSLMHDDAALVFPGLGIYESGHQVARALTYTRQHGPTITTVRPEDAILGLALHIHDVL